MGEDYKLSKWLNNEMNEAELKEFQSSEDYHLYEKIKTYSSELETSTFNSQKLLTKVLSTEKTETKLITFKTQWLIRIAAILVIAFGLFYSYTNFSTSKEFAKNGSKTIFILPDNSEVVLNAGSEIVYKKWFWENNRNLSLIGEAYFKVAKGKKFEVNTNLGKVTVLGTQFDVKSRKNRFDVTCYEGRVKVNYKDEEVILTKGETVSFENNSKIIYQIISETNPLWIKNEIRFEKESLTNIFDEIQRQYDISIDTQKIESNQLFTGKIPTDNIEIAMKIITSSYHINYFKINNSQYILEEEK